MQAKKHNKNVIAIYGKPPKYDQVSFYSYSDFEDAYKEFDKIYCHMSYNNYGFELSAFRRLFILEKFMRENNISVSFTCDCDTLLYCNITDEFEDWGCTAYMIPYEQSNYFLAASTHFAFWKYEDLKDVVDLLMEYYMCQIKIKKLVQKWKYHKRMKAKNKHIGGGICDMTILYMYYDKNKYNMGNLSKVVRGRVFDHGLHTGKNFYNDEYEFDKNNYTKIISMKDDKKFYAYNKKLECEILFKGLHFCGLLKKNMYDHFKMTE